VELAQHMWADIVTLVGTDEVAVGALIKENVEVVVPEIGEDFFELAVAVDGAEQLGFHQVLRDDELRTTDFLDAAAQIRRRNAE